MRRHRCFNCSEDAIKYYDYYFCSEKCRKDYRHKTGRNVYRRENVWESL